MASVPAVAIACADTLGESATWSAREDALYWVDIRGPRLHRFTPATGDHRSWQLPYLCGGVVPMASGVLLALRRELVHFDPAHARLTTLCEIEPAELGNRLNEAKCDPSGRLWVGSMRDHALATTGSLYRVDAALTSRRMLGDITVPNGLAWSPDGTTMYFADTREGAIRAYEFTAASGELGAMRIVSAEGDLPGRPDGSAIDSAGHLWTTRVGAGELVRLAPDGTVSGRIQLPVSQPTSCCFGGAGLRTLFITTARQRLSPPQLRQESLAGHLFMATIDVPGRPDSEFAAAAPIQSTAVDHDQRPAAGNQIPNRINA